MLYEENPSSLRRRAESLLSHRQPEPVKALDGDRLVHELQVHQVELELQNEQLAHTCMELSLLRDRYCDLYDFAPVAYFTVDADGRVVELNLAGARLLGLDRSALSNRRIADFVHADSRALFAQFFLRSLAGSEQIEDMMSLQPQGGARVYVKMQARLFDSIVAGPCIRIVMMDVSELRTANEELQRALEKFFRYWRP